MNFARTKERVIEKTFDYKYTNSQGEEVTEPISITFQERCLTPQFFDTIATFKDAKDMQGLSREVSKALTAWDLDWNGEPFPPSFENIYKRCDMPFVLDIVSEMSSSIMGNAQTPSESANTSVPSEKSPIEKVIAE